MFKTSATKWQDLGPNTPDKAHPIALRGTDNKWHQVSDVRPGHPSAQGVLTAANHWPIPAANVPGLGVHEDWIPPLLLATRRLWDGRRWTPGESTAKDIHPHAETNYTGTKLEFTQLLDAGPSVGGPTLAATSTGWTSAPRTRLFAHLKAPGQTAYLWYEYKEGAYHANNHHQPDNGMTKSRAPITGKPNEYRWNVAIGSGVAKEIAGRACFLLIDGEKEYSPLLVRFAAAAPWRIPTLTGLHGTAASTTSMRLTWAAVPGATSYTISTSKTSHRTSTTNSYTWTGLHEHSTFTYSVIANGPGWHTNTVTGRYTTKAHVPVKHTLTVPIMWTGAYDQNHARRSDHPSNPWQGDLVTGRYSATHGNTYSLARFNTSKIPAGATVTSVKLRLYSKHWYANSGGSAKIRNVGVAATVRGHYTAKTTGHVTYMKWTTKTGYKEVSIATTQAQKDAWRSGGPVNAIQIGPPGSTAQSHYGVFAGSGSRKPRLIVTYTI